ncbi:hypothetical protein TGPRC2_320780 [Toxoplasma gondii TgCatPRC2]|uniref:Uncharacterized protein n=2 Tax=Toxoplasma gondii TaxID=5811 RepID=A0A151HBM3_TOXGO|nr:hypothetical protein TGARI_320780 [Toxoplasma gondii ARI]KYK66731.1 hypothetical protein TGPRC2_320780 [Toxoplasma gondii TgCatPRC2]
MSATLQPDARRVRTPCGNMFVCSGRLSNAADGCAFSACANPARATAVCCSWLTKTTNARRALMMDGHLYANAILYSGVFSASHHPWWEGCGTGCGRRRADKTF